MRNFPVIATLFFAVFFFPNFLPPAFSNSIAANSISYAVSSQPLELAFNPSNNYMYVSDSNVGSTYNSTISILKSPCSTLATIHFPGCFITDIGYYAPGALIYAELGPTNSCKYLPTSGYYSIALIKNTKVVGYIADISLPGTMIIPFLSLSGGHVYVVSGNNSALQLKPGQLASIIQQMATQQGRAAYSPSNNELYLIGGGTHVVYVYGIACSCLKTKIPLSVAATGIAYDPLNSNIYVSGYVPAGPENRTGSVTVISTTMNKIVTVIGTGRHTNDISFSSRTGELYATNLYPINGVTSVSVISGLSVVNTLTVKGAPNQVGYDAYNGFMYVTLYDTGRVAVLSI